MESEDVTMNTSKMTKVAKTVVFLSAAILLCSVSGVLA
jgi:hypothetical protein